MTNTTPDLSYTTVAILAREAYAICRDKYTQQRGEFGLYLMWTQRIDRVQSHGTVAEQIDELERLIAILKGR